MQGLEFCIDYGFEVEGVGVVFRLRVEDWEFRGSGLHGVQGSGFRVDSIGF